MGASLCAAYAGMLDEAKLEARYHLAAFSICTSAHPYCLHLYPYIPYIIYIYTGSKRYLISQVPIISGREYV